MGGTLGEGPGDKKPLTGKEIRSKYKDNPYVANGRESWGEWLDKKFAYGDPNKTIKDTVVSASKYAGIDPALLYTSAMEEGVQVALSKPDNVSEAYSMWSEKNSKDAAAYPVDGFYAYGLDTFGEVYTSLQKKGYLPKDFDKKFKVFEAVNEKNQKMKTAAFADDESALVAKAAMIRQAQDSLDNYAKSKKIQLTPKQKEFFTLAGYNSGLGNMPKMVESYRQKGYLKDDKFMEPGFKPASWGSVYTNVQRRLQNKYVLQEEGYFALGGSLNPEDSDPNMILPNHDPFGMVENPFAVAQETPQDPNRGNFFEIDNTSGTDVKQDYNIVPIGNRNKFVDMNQLEKAALMGMAGINFLSGGNSQGNMERNSYRKTLERSIYASSAPSHGTGSQAIMEFGGTLAGGPGDPTPPQNARKVKTVPQGYVPLEGFKNYFHNPVTKTGVLPQAGTSQQRGGGEKYNQKLISLLESGHSIDELVEKGYGTREGLAPFSKYYKTLEDDFVYIEPEEQPQEPDYMHKKMSERMFTPQQWAAGDASFYVMQGNSTDPFADMPENKVIDFRPINPHTGKPTGDYYQGIPSGEWSNTMGTNWGVTPERLQKFEKYKIMSGGKKLEFGGELEGEGGGLTITDGGGAKQISSSDHSNPMIEFRGKTHDEGGIGINFQGQEAEVENDEVGWVDQKGGLNIFGKLKVPGTNMTFKKLAKKVAKEESELDRKKSKYLEILNKVDEKDPYQSSASSTAKIMVSSLDKRSKEVAEKKEALASYQELILGMANERQQMEYGGRLQFDGGGKLSASSPEEVQKIIDKYSRGKSPLSAKDFIEVSEKYGVPLDMMLAQAIQESHFGTEGRAARTKNIFNVGNTDNGTENHQNSWRDGLETYAKLMQREYTKDGKFDVQGLLSSSFTRPKLGGTYATDKNYGAAVGRILNKINPEAGYEIGGLTAKVDPVDTGTKAPSSTNYDKAAFNLTKVPEMTFFKEGSTFSYQQEEPEGVETQYGLARREANPLSDDIEFAPADNRPMEYMSPLAVSQIAPELLALSTNRREAVYQPSFQPELKQTFETSFQAGRNSNQSSFNQAAKIAELTGNADMIANLAAQKYKADEAYNMQEIQGNAQQRAAVYAANTDTLNQSQQANIGLFGQQAQQQAQAKFNTDQQFHAAVGSLMSKVDQNRLENKTYNVYANLFKHYGFDKTGKVTFKPDDVVRKFNPGEAMEFGMFAARQGLDKVMGNSNKTVTTYDGNGNEKKVTQINSDLEEFDLIMKNKNLSDQQKQNILKKRGNTVFLNMNG